MPFDGSKIYFSFDPWDLLGVNKPKTGSREARRELAEFLLTEILSYVGDGKSPVKGERWKKSLSAAYKDYKEKHSSSSFANMELTGAMLDALEVVPTRDGRIEVRVKGSKQASKADGHNNHSGRSALPQRRFIPDDGQTFKQDIINGMKDIAKDFLE